MSGCRASTCEQASNTLLLNALRLETLKGADLQGRSRDVHAAGSGEEL